MLVDTTPAMTVSAPTHRWCKRLTIVALAVTASVVTTSSWAQQQGVAAISTVHECLINGKRAFQDRPCPAGTRSSERIVPRFVARTPQPAVVAEPIVAAMSQPPTELMPPLTTAMPEGGAAVGAPPAAPSTNEAEMLVEQIRLLELERSRIFDTFEAGRINAISSGSSDEYIDRMVSDLESARDKDLLRINEGISHARSALRSLLTQES